VVFQDRARQLPPRFGPGAQPARETIAVVRDPSIVDAVPQPPGGDDKPKLSGCSWVWFEEKAAQSAPPGKRYFRNSLVLPLDRKIKTARFILTADNEAVLMVNGQKAGSHAEWSRSADLDIAPFLKPGRNQFAILAINATDAPSPAGLIGRYEVTFESGQPEIGRIDETWRAANQEQAGWEQADYDDSAWPRAKVAAAFGQGPWGSPDANRNMTKSYAVADIFHGQCTLPAGVDLAKARVFLELDELAPEAAASITVNGVFAGGFIGKPFRLDVAKHLKSGNNSITISPFAPKTARLLVY
jgi:hypothetical protein